MTFNEVLLGVIAVLGGGVAFYRWAAIKSAATTAIANAKQTEDALTHDANAVKDAIKAVDGAIDTIKGDNPTTLTAEQQAARFNKGN